MKKVRLEVAEVVDRRNRAAEEEVAGHRIREVVVEEEEAVDHRIQEEEEVEEVVAVVEVLLLIQVVAVVVAVVAEYLIPVEVAAAAVCSPWTPRRFLPPSSAFPAVRQLRLFAAPASSPAPSLR